MDVKAAASAAESVLVKVREYRSGILVNGMPILRGLLESCMGKATAHGNPRGSNRPGNIGPFIRRFFEEMDAGLVQYGHFSKKYGSHIRESLPRTTVDIYDLVEETYVPAGYGSPFLLSMNTGQECSKIEKNLAASTGIEQGLRWVAIELTLPTDGAEAEIDINAVLNPLRQILGLPNVTGERLARSMMPTDTERGFATTVLKRVDEEIEVTLCVDSLSFVETKIPEKRLVRSGAVIHGQRRRLGDATASFAPLRARISVSSLNQWRGRIHSHMPVLSPNEKTRMHELAESIAGAFRS